MRFLPHDEKFFDIFDKQIHLVREAAGQLCSSVTGNMSASDAAKAVRWGVARNVLWAWLLTIPASAAVAALAFLVCRLVEPTA